MDLYLLRLSFIGEQVYAQAYRCLSIFLMTTYSACKTNVSHGGGDAVDPVAKSQGLRFSAGRTDTTERTERTTLYIHGTLKKSRGIKHGIYMCVVRTSLFIIYSLFIRKNFFTSLPPSEVPHIPLAELIVNRQCHTARIQLGVYQRRFWHSHTRS